MAVIDQKITNEYAIYNGDCCEVMPNVPASSIGLSVYSPPFCGLYNYSSSPRDMSNSPTYESFFEHYDYLVSEVSRVTQPGRISCVQCTDIPNPGQRTGYFDLPGKIIALHEQHGFYFFGRVAIWKEPLRVAIRTRLKHLTHKHLVQDSCGSTVAAGDYLLIFKRKGANENPVAHEIGFNEYAGGREVPQELAQYKGETEQKQNRLSQWIWRNYASCFWDDIRLERVLPFRDSREADDEKHVHPLQLDVIDRCVDMWSNPRDTVLTPFMGVGSEVYAALCKQRRAIGIELKSSYYKQTVKNIEAIGMMDTGDLLSEAVM